jgi:prolyl-tRNA synthetase
MSKALDYAVLVKFCEDIKHSLVKAGVRADVDSRQNYTPGWKFNHWEQKGVPIRIEVGARDFEAKQYRLVRRDNGEKTDHSVASVDTTIPAMLTTIQADMFSKAKAGRDEKMVQVTKWADFVPALNKHCLVLTPFCDEAEWEEKVKVSRRKCSVLCSVWCFLSNKFESFRINIITHP